MNGEAVTFWIMAPVAVLGALGLVTARKAVHGAMSVAVTMVSLAVLYLAQEAPFLGVVQVVVYTGAIMMLFLFVIMLLGVTSSDSLVETIKGQRAAAVLLGLGLGTLLVTAIGRSTLPEPAGLAAAAPEGNIAGVADLVFTRYVFVFEVLGALLIIAATGAMVLAHRERVERRLTQQELARLRMRPGDDGSLAGLAPLPPPGVYARHNAVDTPALLPDGRPSELSLSRVLLARGDTRHHEADAGSVRRLEDSVEELTRGREEQ